MARVLIADDATVMRINVRKMLDKMGHEVVGEAVNGDDGVKKFAIHHPDLVTMDITMPAINGIKDGIDAVEKIMEINDEVKIIMVTSHGEQDKVIRAIENGASNYILKPIKYEKLEEVISKLGLNTFVL